MPRLLIVIVVLAVSALSAYAQTPPTTVAAQGKLLLQDVNILQRLVPLALTDAQLTSLIALYDASATALAEAAQDSVFSDQTLASLTAIKAKLVAGQALTKTDETVLKGIEKLSGARQHKTAETALLASVEKIQTPRQIELLSRPVTAAANLQDPKARKLLARSTIKAILRAAAVPDDRWAVLRVQISDKLVAEIADEATRTATHDNLLAFEDRLRGMDRREAEKRQDELSEEMLAFFPGSAPNPQALTGLDVQPTVKPGAKAGTAKATETRKQAAALAIFTSPEMPGLLKAIQAGRGTAPTAGATGAAGTTGTAGAAGNK